MDKALPQAIEVERAVLSSMIMSAGACEYAARVLTEDCFHADANRTIFACMKSMLLGFTPIDLITLAEELRRQDMLDKVGAEGYLSEIIENTATSANIKRHCEILNEKAILRGMIATFQRGAGYAFAPDATPEAVLSTAERRILDYRKRLQTINHADVYEHRAAVEAFVEGVAVPLPHNLAGIPWPVGGMNRMTGGAMRKKTTVLSGYTKGGKSRFLRCCAAHWLSLGLAGVYILTEEDKDAVLRCIFASRCKIDTKALAYHTCSAEELDRLRGEGEIFAGQNLFIERQLSASPAFVAEALDRAGNEMIKRGGTLDFCILDTCTKMEKPGYDDNMVKMHADMAEDLLAIADRSGVAMIECMQYLSETERGARTKSALHSMMRFGQFYLESATTSISFDDRRKAKKEIEAERARGYKIVKAHVVQREGESFGYVDTKAELKYSHYSDPTDGEVEEGAEKEAEPEAKQAGFFDGTKDSDLPF
jgi:replicative DNA helicase